LIIGTHRVRYGSSLAKTCAQTLFLAKPCAQTLCQGKVWALRLPWQGPTMTTKTKMMIEMTTSVAVCSTSSLPEQFLQSLQLCCCYDSLANCPRKRDLSESRNIGVTSTIFRNFVVSRAISLVTSYLRKRSLHCCRERSVGPCPIIVTSTISPIFATLLLQ
jgi:hypothetical protein